MPLLRPTALVFTVLTLLSVHAQETWPGTDDAPVSPVQADSVAGRTVRAAVPTDSLTEGRTRPAVLTDGLAPGASAFAATTEAPADAARDVADRAPAEPPIDAWPTDSLTSDSLGSTQIETMRLAEARAAARLDSLRYEHMLDSLRLERMRQDAAAIARQSLLHVWQRSHPFLPVSDAAPGEASAEADRSVDSLRQVVEQMPYDYSVSYAQPTYRMPLVPEGYIPRRDTLADIIAQLNRTVAMRQKYRLCKPQELAAGAMKDASAPFRRQLEYGEERIRQTFAYYQTHLGRTRLLRNDIDIPAERRYFSREAGLHEKRIEVASAGQLTIETFTHTLAKADVWHRHGSHSLQMSQTALTDNWYKGGDNNMSIASDNKWTITRFDEDKKTTFETTVRLQLSGYYTKADTVHSMRVSDNTLRIDINYGYKAWKNWYYSSTTYLKTPVFDYYNTNSKVVKSTFLSPLEWNVSAGMDYKLVWDDKKSSFSLLLAPLSYNLKYVNDSRVAETSYGIDAGKRSLNQFGASVTAKLEWRISTDISLSSRLYYFTDYSSIQAEWENTFNFAVSRYFSAKLYLYPRFDDSRDERLQCKEMLTFGFSYTW